MAVKFFSKQSPETKLTASTILQSQPYLELVTIVIVINVVIDGFSVCD